MAEIKITLEEVYKLMDKLSESGLKELSISDGDFSISIKAKEEKVYSVPATVPMSAPVQYEQGTVQSVEKSAEKISGNVVKSPIVGTFYAAPSPDKAPFVTVGTKVKKGDTLFVVESMKLMNEIASDFDGTVKEILVDNAQTVEFGQPVMVIE